MSKRMFCPKCGANDQQTDSYCTRCGQWLPDMDNLNRPRFLWNKTPAQKIRKMRILEALSAGLSLTSAAIIIALLNGAGDIQMLTLAAFCCIVVAVYQGVNFYLGYKLQQRTDRSRTGDPNVLDDSRTTARRLSAADTNLFVGGAPSAVENTTQLLDPVPRKVQRDR